MTAATRPIRLEADRGSRHPVARLAILPANSARTWKSARAKSPIATSVVIDLIYRLDIALSSVHIFSWNERAIEKAERADFPFLFLARRDTKGNEKTHLGVATLITI